MRNPQLCVSGKKSIDELYIWHKQLDPQQIWQFYIQGGTVWLGQCNIKSNVTDEFLFGRNNRTLSKYGNSMASGELCDPDDTILKGQILTFVFGVYNWILNKYCNSMSKMELCDPNHTILKVTLLTKYVSGMNNWTLSKYGNSMSRVKLCDPGDATLKVTLLTISISRMNNWTLSKMAILCPGWNCVIWMILH